MSLCKILPYITDQEGKKISVALPIKGYQRMRDATGKYKSQVEKNIYEALEFHLEGLMEEHVAIPAARSEAQTFVLQDNNRFLSNPAAPRRARKGPVHKSG